MAISDLNALLTIALNGFVKNDQDAPGLQKINTTFADAYSYGTGANKANGIFAERLDIAGLGTTDTYDLGGTGSGTVTPLIDGVAHNWNSISTIVLCNHGTLTTQTLSVYGNFLVSGSSQVFLGAGFLNLKAGCTFLWSDAILPADVNNTTRRILSIGGATAATSYSMILIGELT